MVSFLNDGMGRDNVIFCLVFCPFFEFFLLLLLQFWFPRTVGEETNTKTRRSFFFGFFGGGPAVFI